jgi:hypothetical protein
MAEPTIDPPGHDPTPPARETASPAARARRIETNDVEAFVRGEVLSPARKRPIVAVSTPFRSQEPLLDVEELARRIGAAADVVVVATGRATRALTAALPPRLDVFGGWIRLWWPGMGPHAVPDDHPLFAVMDPASARNSSFEIDQLLRSSARLPSSAPIAAVVTRAEADFAEVEFDGRRALLRPVAMKRHNIRLLRDAFRPGQRVLVRPLRSNADGSAEVDFLWQGPRRWDRLLSLLAVNDVVRARVVVPTGDGGPYGLHVELLPGCPGVVPIHEIPPELQAQRDLALPGRVVLVRIAGFRAEPRRIDLSMYALPASGRPSMQYSLFEDGPLFLDDATPHPAGPPPLEAEKRRLEAELLDARQRLAKTADELAKTRAQFDLLHELHARDERTLDLQRARIRTLIAEMRDRRRPAASSQPRVADEPDDEKAAALLVGLIESSCVERSTEADRRARPPLRFRIGPRFLATLRELEGIAEAKVVDVCAEVVLGVAERKAGREMHPLGDGAASLAPRLRARDGAKAWRCALQIKTPSARRLHWWRLSDGSIEFASVNRHDDFTIPE